MRLNRRETIVAAVALGVSSTSKANAQISALPLKISNRISERATAIAPSNIKLGGWLGVRVSANANKRLKNIDLEPLLAGYIQKPGSHPWIGEHIGKWLHAATLAWANTGDEALKTKLDGAANRLMAAQESDGYLGTYLAEKRFGLYDGNDWDVWSHKYCLIGLLTYYRYTKNSAALAASQKAADLLIATFPSVRSINKAGTHLGMAATSVLEPIVLLYRLTADEKYLQFAKYIVTSWSEPDGPQIMEALLADKGVRRTANGKAYEMLSNLVGLSELARVTGDTNMITACLNAWDDIVENHLHITGTTSRWEHFQREKDFRGDMLSHVGETCVTTTWIQFNLSLLQLTGEARFGDELERTFYNHLAAAQHPDGDDWCYFTALEGRKVYDKEITCCHSSGPRGMALAPLSCVLLGKENNIDTVYINSFDSFDASLAIDGNTLRISQKSEFPIAGRAQLSITAERPIELIVKIRAPNWALPLNGVAGRLRQGWKTIAAQQYSGESKLSFSFNLGSRIIAGKGSNAGREAFAYGPFVLAADQDLNRAIGAQYKFAIGTNSAIRKNNSGIFLEFTSKVRADTGATGQPAGLRTFADSGANNGSFRVWLRSRNSTEQGPYESVLIGGTESYSRRGPSKGGINDDDYETWGTTKNGTKRDEDWFAVMLDKPKSAITFVFNHGESYDDGGWFDTSANKPIVEIMETNSGPNGGQWREIGRLTGYPPTNAQSLLGANLSPHFDYHLDLEQAVSFVGVRVRGRPSSGNNPNQNFVTCKQLQAFNWMKV